MKKILTLFVIAITGLALNNCIKDKAEEQFVFPLQTGNSWDYIHTQKYTKANSDSASAVFPKADTVSAHMFIAGTKNFGDSILTYEFRVLDSKENSHFGGIAYYKKSDTGLYRHAYIAGLGGGAILPKQGQAVRVRFKGKTYAGVSALLKELMHKPIRAKVSTDSLIIENPSPVVYKYPFVTGEQWTFLEGEDFVIAKLVLGKKNLNTAAGKFTCYKIAWLFDFNNDDKWDDDISYIDYVSKKGLVSRKIEIHGMVFTNEQGQEIETVDFHEEFTLTEYDI